MQIQIQKHCIKFSRIEVNDGTPRQMWQLECASQMNICTLFEIKVDWFLTSAPVAKTSTI